MLSSNNLLVMVVLINWNTSSITLECIKSILRSNYSNLKIILVDNGSAVNELELLMNGLPGCVDLHCLEKNLGYVGGVNYALSLAKSLLPDYILIMNNDTIIDPDAIQHLKDTAVTYNDACIVTGKVLDFLHRDLIQQIGSKLINKRTLRFEALGRNELDRGQYDCEMEFDLIDDVMWLIPYSVLEQVGTYNSMFWFNAEQADFAMRAVKKGNKLIYCHEAKIWHRGSHSIGGRDDNPVLSYWNAQSSVIFRGLHLSKYWFFISLIQMTYNAVYVMLRRVYRNAFHKKGFICPELRGILSGLLILIRGYPNTGYNPYC